MKTSIQFFIFSLAILLSFAYSVNDKESDSASLINLKDSSNTYKDGTFQGHSQSYYISEPYWGHIQITVENGFFSIINFTIRDSSTHEPVDSMYGVNHYAWNPTYQQQCVNDGHGIEIYPQRLITSQDIDNVDAITGATWSHNIFIASVKNALQDAKISSNIENRIEPDKISLEALPNPFTSILTLKYNLSKNSNVELKIYDSHGKLLRKLIDCQQQPDNYTIQWQGCSSSGIYFCLLQTDDIIICKKIIGLINR